MMMKIVHRKGGWREEAENSSAPHVKFHGSHVEYHLTGSKRFKPKSSTHTIDLCHF